MLILSEFSLPQVDTEPVNLVLAHHTYHGDHDPTPNTFSYITELLDTVPIITEVLNIPFSICNQRNIITVSIQGFIESDRYRFIYLLVSCTSPDAIFRSGVITLNGTKIVVLPFNSYHIKNQEIVLQPGDLNYYKLLHEFATLMSHVG